MQKVTIGLGLHRPELIPLTSEHVKRHEAIFLEEPPQTGFNEMLAGRLAVDDYLMQVDAEYPVFSRKMCQLMRELKSNCISLRSIKYWRGVNCRMPGGRR